LNDNDGVVDVEEVEDDDDVDDDADLLGVVTAVHPPLFDDSDGDVDDDDDDDSMGDLAADDDADDASEGKAAGTELDDVPLGTLLRSRISFSATWITPCEEVCTM
jgi:hypothetical protein